MEQNLAVYKIINRGYAHLRELDARAPAPTSLKIVQFHCWCPVQLSYLQMPGQFLRTFIRASFWACAESPLSRICAELPSSLFTQLQPLQPKPHRSFLAETLRREAQAYIPDSGDSKHARKLALMKAYAQVAGAFKRQEVKWGRMLVLLLPLLLNSFLIPRPVQTFLFFLVLTTSDINTLYSTC